MWSENSDEEIYITQSTFRQKSDLVEGDANDWFLDGLSTDEPVSNINVEKEKPAVTNRFANPISDIEIQAKVAGAVPKATTYKDKWAVNLFECWRQQRNERVCNVGEVNDGLTHLNIVQINSLEFMLDEELNRTLALFICEVRKTDGSKYPPNTLHGIIASIQHHLKGKKRVVRLFNDDKFSYLRDALDAMMKESASDGLGLTKKQGEVITLDEEEQLWDKGVLGDSNPQQLLDTMVYLLGIHFALRGGSEHRRLRTENSQIVKGKDKRTGLQYLEYREDVSKTNAGGLKDRKQQRKITRAYENMADKKRCIVRLYEKYISLCPSLQDGGTDAFYRSALKCPKPNCWYSNVPVGHNKLASTVKRLCEQGGISGYRTNHSLRATAATRVYDMGIDEQLICEKTGHRSSAVRAYKRTSREQEMRVSDILYGLNVKKPREESFEAENSQEKKIETEHQNTKKAENSTTVELNKMQTGNAREISVEKAPINITFNFVTN